MEEKHQHRIPVALCLVSAALFGLATPASKALIVDIQPQVLAGLLYIGAAMGVLPAMLRPDDVQWPWQWQRRTRGLMSGAIVLGGITGPLLLLLGLRLSSAGSVSLWLNLEFVATVMLGHFIYRERLTMRGWLAAGGTLVAAVLLTGGQGHLGILSFFLVASACLCWGFDNHFTALIDGIPPSQTTFWKSITAGIFNMTLGLMIFGGAIPALTVVLALLTGAFSYGISVTLYIQAAQRLGATRSQMVFSTAPFFGLLFSVVFLGEPLQAMQMLAVALIAGSLWLLFSEKHAHRHLHRPLSHRHRHQHTDSHHNHRHDNSNGANHHDHSHTHDMQQHEHKHLPDLHHRHDHEDEK